MSLSEAPLCLPPHPLGRFGSHLPSGTVDTHFHVFAEGAPLATPRSYTPRIMTLGDWQAFALAANIGRGVLVQPSVYGSDNSVLLAALAAEPEHLRGIVVVPTDIGRHELERMDRLGVRGIRVNTRNKGGLPFSAIPALAERMADLGWMLQLQLRSEHLEELAALLPSIPCPVVLDHLGFLALDAADAERQVAAVERLLRHEHVYAKLSAPYRLTRAAGYAPFASALERLVASAASRLLWGSDWPHTELFDSMVDDAALIERTLEWLETAGVARQVLVTNAETLFFAR